jgi:hypothetical protein
VHRLEGKRFQDEQVERAAEGVALGMYDRRAAALWRWTDNVPSFLRVVVLGGPSFTAKSVSDMKDPTDRTAPSWSTSPSAKAKNAVQRSVTALLDELAPERVLSRVGQLKGPVEQHRTPSGCVLQAANCAVSVSWFADPTKDAVLGELHVVVWRGKVARRGTSQTPKGATVVMDLVLRPIEPPADNCQWQATDGSRYDTVSLATKCLALLEAQIGLA